MLGSSPCFFEDRGPLGLPRASSETSQALAPGASDLIESKVDKKRKYHRDYQRSYRKTPKNKEYQRQYQREYSRKRRQPHEYEKYQREYRRKYRQQLAAARD